MKYISIIGSTGSIGTQTLDIVRSNKDLKVTALAAGTSIDLLEKQAREFQPVIVAVYNEQKAEELKLRLADTKYKSMCRNGWIIRSSNTGAVFCCCHSNCRNDRNSSNDRCDEGWERHRNFANKETLVTAGISLCQWRKNWVFLFIQ